MRKLSFVPFLLSLLFSSLAFSQAPNKASRASMQQSILSHVNEYRASRGLRPLKIHAVLAQEAEQHSRNMAKHRVPFGHQGFPSRIKRIYAKIKTCLGGSENVAFNYKDTRFLVQEWIKSPGHKRNIVGNYNLTGIGIARDKQGKFYYTQIFVRQEKR